MFPTGYADRYRGGIGGLSRGYKCYPVGANVIHYGCRLGDIPWMTSPSPVDDIPKSRGWHALSRGCYPVGDLLIPWITCSSCISRGWRYPVGDSYPRDNHLSSTGPLSRGCIPWARDRFTDATGFVHDVPKSDRLLFDQFLSFLGTDSGNRHHITCTFGEFRSQWLIINLKFWNYTWFGYCFLIKLHHIHM